MSDVPSTRKTSLLIASDWADVNAASGSASPKNVMSGLYAPPQRQRGTASPLSISSISSYVFSSPHLRQWWRIGEPCTSYTFALPAFWWSMSMFCVAMPLRRPRSSRCASALCTGPGWYLPSP